MTREKDIAGFFKPYAERMLPDDGERFMEELKRNMDRYPLPPAFEQMDPEQAEKYARLLLESIRRNYKRANREALVYCIMSIVLLGTLLFVFRESGLFVINMPTILGMLAVVFCGLWGSSLLSFRMRF